MFTTNNTILLKHTENLPPIYCIQRKGNKVVPTETDMIQANKGSFGDAIGPITNVITSQICLQARFPKGAERLVVEAACAYCVGSCSNRTLLIKLKESSLNLCQNIGMTIATTV